MLSEPHANNRNHSICLKCICKGLIDSLIFFILSNLGKNADQALIDIKLNGLCVCVSFIYLFFIQWKRTKIKYPHLLIPSYQTSVCECFFVPLMFFVLSFLYLGQSTTKKNYTKIEEKRRADSFL